MVNVYSPTRAIRTPGRVANAGTASRITRPQVSAPQIRSPQFNVPGAAVPIEQRLAQQSAQQQQEPESPGGWRGLLGSVVNNPIGRAIMLPLQLMDYPRRAVQSTVQEAFDVFTDGDASWSDWREQVADPEFGFGSMDLGFDKDYLHYFVPPAMVAHMLGSDKWADRFVGFSGDVLMDPLTYVSGASAMSTGGRAGRMSLASRALQGGLGEETANKILRFGTTGLSEVERQALREARNLAGEFVGEPIRRAGYYLEVPFSERAWRIPGTGGLERAISAPLTGLRAGYNATWLGKTMAMAKAPEAQRAAYETLIRGTGNMSFSTALEVIGGSNAWREGVGEAIGRGSAMIFKLQSLGHDAETLKQMRHAVETGSSNEVKEVLDELADLLVSKGFPEDRIKANYIPMLTTDAGAALLKSKTTPGAQEFAERFYKGIDFEDPSPSLLHRKVFLPDQGDITFAGKTVNFGKATINEVNEAIRKAFPEMGPDFRFLEEDVSEILNRYVKSIAKDVGDMTMQRRLASSYSRLVRRFDDDEVTRLATNEELTRFANDEVAKQMRKELSQAKKRIKELNKVSSKGLRGIQGDTLEHVRGAIDVLATLDNRTKTNLDNLVGQLATNDAAITALREELARNTDMIDARFDALTSEMAKYSARAAADMKAWQAAGAKGPMPESLRRWNSIITDTGLVGHDRELLRALTEQADIHDAAANHVERVLGDGDLLDLMARHPVMPGPGASLGEGVREGQQWIDGLGRVRTGRQFLESRDPVALTRNTLNDVTRRASDARTRITTGLNMPREVDVLNGKIRDAGIRLNSVDLHLAKVERQYAGQISEAINDIETVQSIQLNYQKRLTGGRWNGVWGDPAKQRELTWVNEKLNETTQQLIQAQQRYQELIRPVEELRAQRQTIANEIEDLQRLQISRVPRRGAVTAPDQPAVALPYTADEVRDMRTAHQQLTAELADYDKSSAGRAEFSMRQRVRTLTQGQGNRKGVLPSLDQEKRVLATRNRLFDVDEQGWLVPTDWGQTLHEWGATGTPLDQELADSIAMKLGQRDAARTDLDQAFVDMQAARREVHEAGLTGEGSDAHKAAIAKLQRIEDEYIQWLKLTYATEKDLARHVGIGGGPRHVGPNLENVDRFGIRYEPKGAGRMGKLLDDELAARIDLAKAQNRLARHTRAQTMRAQRDSLAQRLESQIAAQTAQQADAVRRGVGAVPVDDTPPLVRQLQRINEGEAAERARIIAERPTIEMRWEPADISRRQMTGIISDEDRMRLESAYRTLQTTPANPRSRDMKRQVANARKIIRDVDNGAIGELMNRASDDALSSEQIRSLIGEADRLRLEYDQAKRFVANMDEAARNMVSPHAQARATIREIEARMSRRPMLGGGTGISGRSGVTQARLNSDTMVSLQRHLDDITATRLDANNAVRMMGQPFLPDTSNMRSFERGREAHRISTDMLRDHARTLVDHRAFSQAKIDRIAERTRVVGDLLDAYQTAAQPFVSRRLEQESRDLMREAEMMVVYRAAIEQGVEPSRQVGAYLLRQRMTAESEQLAAEMAQHEARRTGLVAGIDANRAKEEARWQGVLDKESKIVADQRALRKAGAGNFDAGELKRAQNRVSQANGALKTLAEQRRSIAEAGALDDVVDAVVTMFRDQLADYGVGLHKFNQWGKALHGGRYGYASKTRQLQTQLAYMEAEDQILAAARERLQRAVEDAKSRGLTTVEWFGTRSRKVQTTTREAERYLGMTAPAGAEAVEEFGPLGRRAMTPDEYRRAFGKEPPPELGLRDKIASPAGPGAKPVRGRQARKGRVQAMQSEPGAMPIALTEADLPAYRRADIERRVADNQANKRQPLAWTNLEPATEPTRLTLEQAELLLAVPPEPRKIAMRSTEQVRYALELRDGTAARRVEELDGLLRDLDQPPSVAELNRRNAEIRSQMRRQKRKEMTVEEAAEVGANTERIEQVKEMAAGNVDVNEVRAGYQSERERLVRDLDALRQQLEVSEQQYFDAVASLTDPEQMIDDIVKGRRVLDDETRETLIAGLQSAEGGKLAAQMIGTLQSFDPNVMSTDMMLDTWRSLYGDTKYLDTVRSELASVSPEGELAGAPVPLGGDFAEAADNLGTGTGLIEGEVDTGTIITAHQAKEIMEATLSAGLRRSARDNYMMIGEEINSLVEVLGFDLLAGQRQARGGATRFGVIEAPKIETTVRQLGFGGVKGITNTRVEKLMAGGLTQEEALRKLAGQAIDETKLRTAVTQQLARMGYDPTNSQNLIYREMQARMTRLQSTINALGGMMLSDLEPTDQVRLFAWLENARRGKPTTLATTLDNEIEGAIQFQNMVPHHPAIGQLPATMDTLRTRLEVAAEAGDEATVASLQAQIDLLEEMGVTAPPTGQTAEDWLAKATPLRNDIKEAEEKLRVLHQEMEQLSRPTPTMAVTTAGEELDAATARSSELLNSGRDDAETMAEIDRISADMEAFTAHVAEVGEGGPPLRGATEAGTAEVDNAARRADLQRQIDAVTNEQQRAKTALDELGDQPESPDLEDVSHAPDQGERSNRAVFDPVTNDTSLDPADLESELTDVNTHITELLDPFEGNLANATPEVQAQVQELLARSQQLTSDLNQLRRHHQLMGESLPTMRGGEPVPGSSYADMMAGPTGDAQRIRMEVNAAAMGEAPPVNWETVLDYGIPANPSLRQALTMAAPGASVMGVTVTPQAHELGLKGLQGMFDEGGVPRRVVSSTREAAETRARMAGSRPGRDPEQFRERLTQIAERERSAAVQKRARAAEGETLEADTTRRVEGIVRNVNAAQRARDARAARITDDMVGHGVANGRLRSQIDAANRTVGNIETARAKLNDAVTTIEGMSYDEGIDSYLDDMRSLVRGLDGFTTEQANTLETMLSNAARTQKELNDLHATEDQINKRLDQWKNASRAEQIGSASLVNPVLTRVIQDGWQPIANGLLKGDDALIIATELSNAMQNVTAALYKTDIWGVIEKYSAFFKTYATARPGFHVRNAMSGVFMNIVAGVKPSRQLEALGVWRSFADNPIGWWRNATERERSAMIAVFGSGAGGQFHETGIGSVTGAGGKAYGWLMNNRLTNFNRKWGGNTEGVMRLGMALDSIDRGHPIAGALDRITKYHFDYTQVSGMDRRAKLLIPFWTFMSRNFPLQVEQMWLKPRAYAWYQSFVRNVAETPDPLTPDYWLAQGAFTTDPNAADKEKPWYLAPDLPFLRIAEPAIAASQGDWSKTLFSDVNPLFLAPVEALYMGHKAYTGAPIEGYEEVSPAMKPLQPLFQMLGLTETGGTTGNTLVDERAAHIVRSLVPPIDIAERLLPGGDPESVRSGREAETWARFFGAPVYNLTPQLRESQANSAYYDALDEQQAAADLARM